MKSRRHLVVVAGGALLMAACGGSSDDADELTSGTADATESSDEAPATTAETAATTAPPTTEAGGGAATSYDQVQPAVIQILATGTIRDPEVGMATTAGSGSGFIISPDGIAVTNNHVVTGAATLEVFIGGDDKGHNARVLGVSECNDLAVIKIDTNEPLPTLAWQDGPPTVGQEVYAAGFPLGDPEFTLTRGIVAKAEAGGDTQWASIDSTIEHDANIQPGNSGGPLVGTDGKVVAVNYASGSQTNTSQFFAINSQLAQNVVEQLKNGDFETLGINGQVVVDQEQGLAGVWVAGVQPGSPVDVAGVQPGDIVTALNDLPIGTDGTMKDYCDVIRTARPDTPMDIEVLRFDTQEILRGQLYGDAPIEAVFSFAEEVGQVDETVPASAAYSGYTTLVDDTGSITVEVPNEWASIDTAPAILDDGTEIPYILASTDIDAWRSSYDVPGLLFVVTAPTGDIAASIADFSPAPGDCTDDYGISDYDDGLFVGQYQFWSGCGSSGASFVVLVANPADASYTAILATQIITDADWEALDQAFATFNVTS